jgi:hypothetical protein
MAHGEMNIKKKDTGTLELLLNFNVNGLGAARDMGTSWRGFV